MNKRSAISTLLSRSPSNVTTSRSLRVTPPIQFGHLDRFGPGLADAAEQRTLDHEHAGGPVDRAVEGEHEGLGVRVVLAQSPPAEAARAHGRKLTVPALHQWTSGLRSGSGRREPEAT